MAETLQPVTLAPPAVARRSLLGYAPALTLALFLLPIAAGLIGTWLPAFGYLPALGHDELSLAPWRQLMAYPGLEGSLRLTLVSGFLAAVVSFALTIAFLAACHDTRLFAALRRLLAPLLSVLTRRSPSVSPSSSRRAAGWRAWPRLGPPAGTFRPTSPACKTPTGSLWPAGWCSRKRRSCC